MSSRITWSSLGFRYSCRVKWAFRLWFGLIDVLALRATSLGRRCCGGWNPTDFALQRRVNRGSTAAVEASSDLPRAGVSVEVEVDGFVWCVRLMAWGKENGCPWEEAKCASTAGMGS